MSVLLLPVSQGSELQSVPVSVVHFSNAYKHHVHVYGRNAEHAGGVAMSDVIALIVQGLIDLVVGFWMFEISFTVGQVIELIVIAYLLIRFLIWIAVKLIWNIVGNLVNAVFTNFWSTWKNRTK